MASGLLNFVVIGAKNSGKTVYLSTLFGLESTVASANKETLKYLEDNWKLLRKGNVPSATSGRIMRLEFEYRSDLYAANFTIDDYDGYFVETLSSDDEHTQDDRDRLKTNIKEAEGLLFLFPFEKKHDDEALERFQYEIDTFIQLIKEIYPNRRDLPIPTIIAVSKWDQSPYFKAEDEKEQAIAYVNTIESYKSAMTKINSFFSHVEVQTISSFGKSQDGIHPVEGEIEPYRLTTPFDYFLSVTFQKFEEKVAELKTAGDNPSLFRFLSMIYDDVKFYKDAILIEEYEKIEKDYAYDVIDKLKSAPDPGEQRQILDEHIYLYENLRDKELIREIDTLVKSRKVQSTKKKVIICGVTVFILLLGIYCFGAYKAYIKEHNTFMAIKHLDLKANPGDFIVKCRKYLEDYKSKSFFLPITDISDHRKIIGESLSSAQINIATNLKDTFEVLRDGDLTTDTLAKLNDLVTMANLFPDLEISLRITSFSEDFNNRLEQNANKLRNINEAKALLAVAADISEIDDLLTRLNELPEDETITDIKNKLVEKRRLKVLSENFGNLYNEVKYAELFDIPKVVSRKWNKDFPEKWAGKLKILIQDRISKKDREAIANLNDRFESANEIMEQERSLAEIGRNSMQIPQIRFRYVREPYLVAKFQRAKVNSSQYKDIIENGLRIVGVAFGTYKEDNEPLGFGCALTKGKDIILRIDNDEFSYKKKPKPLCRSIGPEKQQLLWKKSFILTPKMLSIKALEVDFFDNDPFLAFLNITKDDLLYIYNTGEKEIAIPGSDYYILFVK